MWETGVVYTVCMVCVCRGFLVRLAAAADRNGVTKTLSGAALPERNTKRKKGKKTIENKTRLIKLFLYSKFVLIYCRFILFIIIIIIYCFLYVKFTALT